MRNARLLGIALVAIWVLSACGSTLPGVDETSLVPGSEKSTPFHSLAVSAAAPCIGAPAPSQWSHIVVLMFENKEYDQIIGKASYITNLAEQCATVLDWKDANTKVDGSRDGKYVSKPNYATLTTGLPPSVHGLLNDDYHTTTDMENIYSQLQRAGYSFKSYYDGRAGGCDVRFRGDYHDPLRYYTDLASICDEHDFPLSTFAADVESGNLPAFSMILPSNKHNMHDNSISNGDEYAKTILDPLLNSVAYANGDVAIFFLWDENTPVPNVLLAPSIKPGYQVIAPAGNPISHYSALRTWEEMLGLPLLGDTHLAPSLLPVFEGR